MNDTGHLHNSLWDLHNRMSGSDPVPRPFLAGFGLALIRFMCFEGCLSCVLVKRASQNARYSFFQFRAQGFMYIYLCLEANYKIRLFLMAQRNLC